ncbi:hypothetical protein R1flu_020401 [Riccia fluitans]|uniref:Uncharacterized protein n=1 Tax=Riccia fluitans TaxID=41844 RepID=A0ABD1ZLF8_9MARC
MFQTCTATVVSSDHQRSQRRGTSSCRERLFVPCMNWNSRSPHELVLPFQLGPYCQQLALRMSAASDRMNRPSCCRG